MIGWYPPYTREDLFYWLEWSWGRRAGLRPSQIAYHAKCRMKCVKFPTEIGQGTRREAA